MLIFSVVCPVLRILVLSNLSFKVKMSNKIMCDEVKLYDLLD